MSSVLSTVQSLDRTAIASVVEQTKAERGLFNTNRQAFNQQLIDGLMALPKEYSLVSIRVDDKGNPTKAPRGKAWEKTEYSCESIASQVGAGSVSGIGIKLGEPSGGIVALDIDGLEAQKLLAEILGDDVLPKTVAFTSGKPGCAQHLFYVPQDKQAGLKTKKEISPNKLTAKAEDLDFRWTGTQSVLPPSAHPETPCYFWIEGCSPDEVAIAELPEKLLNYWLGLINPKRIAKSASKPNKATHSIPYPENKGDFDKMLAVYVDKLTNHPEGGRNTALNDAAYTLAGLFPDKVGIIRAGLTQAAVGCGLDLNEIEATLNSALVAGVEKPISAIVAPSGKPNILTLDASIAAMGETVRLNLMSDLVEVGGVPLDLDMVRRFTMHKFGYTLNTEDAIQCWLGAGQENPYHPVVEYLRGLPASTPTLDLLSLSSKLLGNDSPLAAVMLKKKLIAAVARVMQPGCQDDAMFVLSGAQGLGKTRFIAALASKPWFTNDLTDIHNKDHIQLLKEKWLIEMGEVDGVMSKKEDAILKAFISKDEDTYRQAYKRGNVHAKRSSSIFATTNKTDILQDPTGSRRYWIVEAKQRIDVTHVAGVRDSIWYSALEAYDNGEQWHLTDEEDKERMELAKQFTEVDPWADSIRMDQVTRKRGGGYITAYVTIYEQLQIPMTARNKGTDRRLNNILTQMGFEFKYIKVEGKSVKCWYTEAKSW